MTYSETINPEDPFSTMKRDGTFDGYNDFAFEIPDYNPRGWGATEYNPDGKVPILNPEHYINPLSGRYTTGPLHF